MNALAHCAEALYALDRSPRAERHAFTGARAIAYALPLVVAATAGPLRPRPPARGRVSRRAGARRRRAGAAHAMAQALGGRFGTAHGAANALCLAPALRFNAAEVPRALATLGGGDAGRRRAGARRGARASRRVRRACATSAWRRTSSARSQPRPRRAPARGRTLDRRRRGRGGALPQRLVVSGTALPRRGGSPTARGLPKRDGPGREHQAPTARPAAALGRRPDESRPRTRGSAAPRHRVELPGRYRPPVQRPPRIHEGQEVRFGDAAGRARRRPVARARCRGARTATAADEQRGSEREPAGGRQRRRRS